MDEKKVKNQTEEYDEDKLDEEDVINEDDALTGLFKGRKLPTPKITWEMYQRGRQFNQQINLEETVKVNENFFIGKQWEGVAANNLPTPQINILKRTGMFTVATTVSDNIKATASPLANTVGTTNYKKLVGYVNDEFEAIFERNKIPSLIREFARDAAVDGDGCIYAFWDKDAPTGQKMGDVDTLVNGLRIGLGKAVHMFLGHDQRMSGRQGIHIQNCQNMFVFVYFAAGNIAGNDLTEYTHIVFLLNQL